MTTRYQLRTQHSYYILSAYSKLYKIPSYLLIAQSYLNYSKSKYSTTIDENITRNIILNNINKFNKNPIDNKYLIKSTNLQGYPCYIIGNENEKQKQQPNQEEKIEDGVYQFKNISDYLFDD